MRRMKKKENKEYNFNYRKDITVIPGETGKQDKVLIDSYYLELESRINSIMEKYKELQDIQREQLSVENHFYKTKTIDELREQYVNALNRI